MSSPLHYWLMMCILSISLTDIHASTATNNTLDNANFAFEVPVVIWDGITWTPAAPTIAAIAILTEEYSTAAHGSFTALSLTVNEGVTLTVDNNTYVKLKTTATVDGHIVVHTKGAFVQVDDIGTFNLSSTGTAVVNKLTAPLNRWYDYTYWSSPV